MKKLFSVLVLSMSLFLGTNLNSMGHNHGNVVDGVAVVHAEGSNTYAIRVPGVGVFTYNSATDVLVFVRDVDHARIELNVGTMIVNPPEGIVHMEEFMRANGILVEFINRQHAAAHAAPVPALALAPAPAPAPAAAPADAAVATPLREKAAKCAACASVLVSTGIAYKAGRFVAPLVATEGYFGGLCFAENNYLVREAFTCPIWFIIKVVPALVALVILINFVYPYAYGTFAGKKEKKS